MKGKGKKGDLQFIELDSFENISKRVHLYSERTMLSCFGDKIKGELFTRHMNLSHRKMCVRSRAHSHSQTKQFIRMQGKSVCRKDFPIISLVS
jgi:hypothetical protein